MTYGAWLPRAQSTGVLSPCREIQTQLHVRLAGLVVYIHIYIYDF